MQKLLEAWGDGLALFITAILPGAFGSFVAVAYEWDPGLRWGQRLTQWIAGICVSFYVGRGMSAVFHWDGFGVQSVSFVTGMIAFKAAPRFIAKAADVIGDLPADIRDRFLPRKGEK